MATARILASLTVVGLLLASAGSVAAEQTALDTPEGTYYVEADRDVDLPELSERGTCILMNCFLYPWPGDPGGASASFAVYEETNGCDGLQTEAGDCDEDPAVEDADREVLAVENGEVRQDLVDV